MTDGPLCSRCKQPFVNEFFSVHVKGKEKHIPQKKICPDCGGGSKPHIDLAVDELARRRNYNHRLKDGFSMMARNIDPEDESHHHGHGHYLPSD